MVDDPTATAANSLLPQHRGNLLDPLPIAVLAAVVSAAAAGRSSLRPDSLIGLFGRRHRAYAHRSASLADMEIWLADGFFRGAGQGGRQIIELLTAFGLTALIGLERTVQGKSAGLRTQTIVGTSAALIILVSKYGFGDIISADTIVLDPSRVAAQIVSGIGFLGAGIIITRRSAVHGLTTDAAVWESAAIGMAAGAGMLLVAISVVALHFVSALAFTTVEHQLNARLRGSIRLHIIYEDSRGVLRRLLQICGERKWQLAELEADACGIDDGQVGVILTLSGVKIASATQALAGVDGVAAVLLADEEPD
jgi:putative Mg2+ transporter-C (MgtC) family protein